MPISRWSSGSSAVLLAVLLFGSAAWGQAPAAKGKKQAPPEPEDITLETKDGVSIRATWYAGLAKEDSIPIIMVHGWEGQRGEYVSLAKGLQALGHSVITPDLRGHGESTTRRKANGESETFAAEDLTRRDLEACVLDLEACKKFLREKNNAKELNIEALCLVGADFGGIVAMRWAALDWSAPRLPSIKQGQDVKAIVLLTPVRSHKGLTMSEPIGHPAIRKAISFMIVAGKDDSKGSAEAKRLMTSLEAQRPKVDKQDMAEKQDLFLVQPPTSLQGTKLLGGGLPVPGNIAKFIELRLVNKLSQFPWSERGNLLGN